MAAFPTALKGPVGPGQVNNADDIHVLRALLNRMIDGGYLIPLAPLPAEDQYDDRVAYALSQVERRYFHGMADPDRQHKLETKDSLFQFLLRLDTTKSSIGETLSPEVYELAAKMVPGGIDRVKKTTVKTTVMVKGKPVVKKEVKKEIIPGNIRTYMPAILDALSNLQLNDTDMVMMALGTIRAETAGFDPIDEGISQYNTSPSGTPGHHPFDLYDHRTDLGNDNDGDGALYKGRGFVQLTGHDNYQRVGKQIGVDLLADPDLADQSDVAAKILARFLKNREAAIRQALADDNLKEARRLVNGGSHGLQEFKDAFKAGREYLHITVAKPVVKPKAKK